MKIWHLRDEGIKRWGLGLSLEEGRSSLLVLLSLGKSLTCALSGRVLPASVTQVTATPCSALWTCSSVLPTSVTQVTATSCSALWTCSSVTVLPASVTQVMATSCSALWTCSSVLPTSVKQVTAISRKNAFLPPSLLIDLYMPTATCFIFVCVCVCQLGAGMGTGRNGIKGTL